jgi:hypothetical protein
MNFSAMTVNSSRFYLYDPASGFLSARKNIFKSPFCQVIRKQVVIPFDFIASN